MNPKIDLCLAPENDEEQDEVILRSNQNTLSGPHISFVRDQMVHPRVDDSSEQDTAIGPRSNQEVMYRSDYIRAKMAQW